MGSSRHKATPFESSEYKAKTTPMGSSGHKDFLPLLVIAGTGAAAVGVAFMSTGLWGKTITFLKQHCQQNALLRVAFGDVREDRISQLPDDLLSFILSHLDLTECIRTRILSKRWKDVCKFRSKLVLDCRLMCGECQDFHNGTRSHLKQRFLKAVDEALQLYSGPKIDDVHNGTRCHHKQRFLKAVDQALQLYSVNLADIARIMDSCPLLELFRLQARCPSEHGQWGWPVSCYRHLLEFRYDGFYGTIREMEFACHVVQNAPALRAVFLYSGYNTYSSDHKWSQNSGDKMYPWERQMICDELVHFALSTEVKVTFVYGRIRILPNVRNDLIVKN